jgi:hypothetical protein
VIQNEKAGAGIARSDIVHGADSRPRNECASVSRQCQSWIIKRAIATHPLASPNKFFAMLQAYIDDSGSHDKAHNCLLGGYWGGVNEWRKFERKWKAVLDHFGILAPAKRFSYWPL